MKHNWIPERKLAGGWLCLLLVLLLTGCAATSILPRHYHEPAQVQSYKLGLVTAPGQTEDSLLVVQPDAGGASRWIQTNPLGAPLARLLLRDGDWTNDGFAPPNPRARQLFEAIIAAQIGKKQWANAYPEVDITPVKTGGMRNAYTFSRHGRTLWSLQLPATPHDQGRRQTAPPVSDSVIHITLPDDSQWQLTPIATSP
ncbi:hypothetical protein CAP48_01305 [Advenella sp. S44]|uniref:hypothetical protein n=1 Tax=Advenella sp. S44 TaxID=1982755 RepID=UPI000CC081F2|nr:hypothetical protein [Advenella sp. S44]PJX27857.1 hypothetical protein CAP48_01305 [Advenella sp. S44]